MTEQVRITGEWTDVIAAAALATGDERTLVARDGPIEIRPAPAGGAAPAAAARGDVLWPGTFQRAADRPTLTVTTGLKLWARVVAGEAVLVLTDT